MEKPGPARAIRSAAVDYLVGRRFQGSCSASFPSSLSIPLLHEAQLHPPNGFLAKIGSSPAFITFKTFDRVDNCVRRAACDFLSYSYVTNSLSLLGDMVSCFSNLSKVYFFRLVTVFVVALDSNDSTRSKIRSLCSSLVLFVAFLSAAKSS